MSRSWASSVLYLAPDRVVLRMRGATHIATVAEPGWPGALAALQSLLQAHKPGGRVAVVLSSHFAPVWLLPGTPTALNFEETRGWVESQVAERFGELAANWRLAFRPAPAGAPILASGLDAAQWAELMHALAETSLSAVAVTSWPALALARYGKRGAARLALVEAGRLTLASLARGEAVALDSARGDDMERTLADLLPRAVLADGLGEAPLQLLGTGVACDWRGARVLANAVETATLSGRADLDFLRAHPRPPLVAWLLLAAGLGLAALTGQRYTALAQQQATMPGTVVSAQSRRERAAVAPETPARPWGALLNRLETHRPEQIALLSLRGDAPRGEARITAEARSESDMLAWLKTLRMSGFADASLVRHEIQGDDEQQPLRFELRLGWGTP